MISTITAVTINRNYPGNIDIRCHKSMLDGKYAAVCYLLNGKNKSIPLISTDPIYTDETDALGAMNSLVHSITSFFRDKQNNAK